MKNLIYTLAAAMALVSVGNAQTAGKNELPDVLNTSSASAAGERTMQLSVVVPASRAEVWAAFTTSDGYRSWATPLASVELKVDGIIETSYDAAAKLGSPDNIRNQITAYVPERLLVMRNVQTPTGFPNAAELARTAVIIELEALDTRSTRVTLTGVGYGPGPKFDELFRMFEWANSYSLAELKARFVGGPVDWADRAAKEKAQTTSQKVKSGERS
jgi:uncharacterized protein YndB with AHSA1/START domain